VTFPDISPAPFALGGGWTALLIADVPGDALLLLVDGQLVELLVEPDEVRGHLAALLERLAPESTDYDHDDEGVDDMPGHLRSAITRTGEVVGGGRLLLGTWQAIYLWEHRTAPHRRRIVVTVSGVPERAEGRA
jgi:hypothetical protein